MRSRPISRMHLLMRLLMAVLLLAGAGIPSSPGMAASGMVASELGESEPTGHASLAQFDDHQHGCCEPGAADAACVVGCSAVTCATPILPALEATLSASRNAVTAPPAMRFLRSHRPELETPPPRA